MVVSWGNFLLASHNQSQEGSNQWKGVGGGVGEGQGGCVRGPVWEGRAQRGWGRFTSANCNLSCQLSSDCLGKSAWKVANGDQVIMGHLAASRKCKWVANTHIIIM